MTSIKTLIFIISSTIICTSQNFTISPIILPQRTFWHATGIFNNVLTIINGKGLKNNEFNNIASSFSIVLEPTSTIWKQNTFTLPLHTHGIFIDGDTVVQVNDLLYIINPNNDGNQAIQYNILLVYSLSTHEYIQTETPFMASLCPCVTYNKNNNIIYIIGGIDIEDSIFNGLHETQTYNITSNSFGFVSDIEIARGYSGCAMDHNNEYIFLFGGASNRINFVNDMFLDSIEKYSVIDDEWIILSQRLNTPKANIVCNLLPTTNQIYCSSNLHDAEWEVFNTDEFIIHTTHINIVRESFGVSLWADCCLLVTGGIGDDMKLLNSTEHLGICSLSTVQPTIDTIDTTDTTDTTVDSAEMQCFVGDACTKRWDCCEVGVNVRKKGIACRHVDFRSRSPKFCCVKRWYSGCISDDNCCGKKSVCCDGKCVKKRQVASKNKRKTRFIPKRGCISDDNCYGKQSICDDGKCVQNKQFAFRNEEKKNVIQTEFFGCISNDDCEGATPVCYNGKCTANEEYVWRNDGKQTDDINESIHITWILTTIFIICFVSIIISLIIVERMKRQ